MTARNSRQAALWTIIATAVGAVAQLVQISVAARYLDAHEFGALAIVTIMMSIVTGFQDMGLSSYCIHLGDAPRRTHSTLFWISSALGVVGAVAAFATSGLIADFYRIPTLSFLLKLLSINFLLIGLSSQYQANYIRVFKAQALAQIELAARLVGLGTALWLLVSVQLGPTAIVIGTGVFALVRLIIMALLADKNWHPLLEFERDLAFKALKYGSFQAGSQIVNQLRTQADQLIIGRALGADVLGIYSIAKELLGYPMRFMQPLISRLTLPTYAKHQNDPNELRLVFVAGLKRVAGISGVVYSALILLSPWLVEILYGAKFAIVASLMPAMILFGVLRPMGMNTGMLAQATGRTANEFRWNVGISFVTLTPNLVIAYFFPSLFTFAVALSIIQVSVSILAYPFFIKPLEAIGFVKYIRTWIIPALTSLAVAALMISGWFTFPSLLELTKFTDFHR